MRTLLGLPKEIRQEDGSRDAFERVFQVSTQLSTPHPYLTPPVLADAIMCLC